MAYISFLLFLVNGYGVCNSMLSNSSYSEWNLNWSQLFRNTPTLLSTKCCQIVAIATLWQSSIVEFDQMIFHAIHDWQHWHVYVSNKMLNMCCIIQLYFIYTTCILTLNILALQYSNTQQSFILPFFMSGGSLKIKYAVNSVRCCITLLWTIYFFLNIGLV